jgi:hypothetical protein
MYRNTVLALSLLASCAASATELVVNGSFEQNGGVESTVFEGWTHSDTGSGSWYVQKGLSPAPSSFVCSEIQVPAPPSGVTAMVNAPTKGTRLLYQDVAIPAGVKATFSFDVAFSTTNNFNPAPTLDENLLNQQFRADIMDPAAPLRDTGSGVLLNAYQTKTGDPLHSEYTRISRDISAFAGRTIRVRFAEVDHQFCLLAGIDNVSIDVTPLATIEQFSAAKQGDSTLLSWQFSGSASASLFDVTSGSPQLLGKVTPSGSMTVTQPPGVYTLNVDGGPSESIVLAGSIAATGTIGSGLRGATAVAVDPNSGEVFVIDSGVPSVVRIGAHGVLTRVWAQPSGGVAIDASGNLYVADTADHEIRKLSPDGHLTHFAGSNANLGDTDGNGIQARFNAPSGMALDGNGNLLVADTGNHSVRRVTPQGDVTTVARFDITPRWVAAGPGGTIYVSSDSDVRMAGSGVIFWPAGGPIATDRAGNLYLVTNGTLVEIAPDGHSTVLAGVAGTSGTADGAGTNARFDHSTAIAVARTGRIFVADRTAVRIVVPPVTAATTRRRSAGR